MTIAAEVIYENHLKKAYSVKDGQKHLAITDTSCYHLGEETACLVTELPASGGKELYFNSLAGLGIEAPQKIFDRLLSLGVLQEQKKRTWKDALGMVFSPKIRLLPAQLQEKFLSIFLSVPAARNICLQTMIILAVFGLVWGLALFIAGPGNALPVPLVVKANGGAVVLLVILGSLIHELGHSFAAMSAGIGLRPIGFSVYLIYPVFYTNVSGIEKVSLTKRTLIDCGGFIFQGVFLLLLLSLCSLTGRATLEEAARWMAFIISFNLNPLFRTDGYWLYKDVYTEHKTKRWAQAAHYLYLAAFLAFSVYFLWRVAGRLGNIWHGLNILFHSPEYFFSGGYRIVLGAYFIFVGLSGGLRRFQEGHQEWIELRKVTTSVNPEKVLETA